MYVSAKDDTVEGVRVYEALGSISIDPMYDFRALNTFNVTEGNTISVEMPLDVSCGASNWSSFVIPFVPPRLPTWPAMRFPPIPAATTR